MKTTDISQTNYIALPGLKPGTMFCHNVSATHITNIVGETMDVTPQEMYSRHRYRRLVEARQIAMFLIRKHTTRSLKDIAYMFGGRDHTTAIHSIQTVENLSFSNEDYRNRLLKIENNL